MDIAWEMYFLDVISLVKAGVEKDISSSVDGEEPTELQKKERRKALKSWSEEKHILDHGTPLRLLIRAVVTDPTQIINGLSGMDTIQISYDDVAKNLWVMYDKSTTGAMKVLAPAITRSSFSSIIIVAIRSLIKYKPSTSIISDAIYVQHLISRSMGLNKIHFLPWYPDVPSQGRPLRTPSWNCWAAVNMPANNGCGIQPQYLSGAEAALHASQVAVSRARDADPNADWEACRLPLHKLQTVLDRARLPLDFKLPLPLSGYVKDTYEYVLMKYDASNPVHKYALLIGIILANCLPGIFFPADTVETIKRAGADRSPDTLVDYCRTSLPWVEKENIKGVTDGRKHLVMFTVFIIALYDESSPLRQHMVASNTLGNPWTDKHSKSLSAYYIPLSALNSSI